MNDKINLRTFHDYIELRVHSSKYSLYRVALSVTYAHLTSETFAQAIYALRDLLEQMFPKSDVRMLLKELLDKGYIYWNGHEVLYSHEMFLN